MNKLFLTLIFFVSQILARAQNLSDNAPEMADTFRDNGKIYVVIAVIALIFVSIVAFLVYLERKLSKLEKTIQEKEQKKN